MCIFKVSRRYTALAVKYLKYTLYISLVCHYLCAAWNDSIIMTMGNI